MKIEEWITLWMSKIRESRFDAADMYKMHTCRLTMDYLDGLSPLVSAMNCLEEIEDFISRYSEVKKC